MAPVLLVQNDSQKGLVDLDFAVVLDEAQLPELVHEHIDPRTRCADDFRQHLLRYLLKYPLWLVFLAIASEEQKGTRQSLLRRVEELIDQVRLNPDVPRQHVMDETVG